MKQKKGFPVVKVVAALVVGFSIGLVVYYVFDEVLKITPSAQESQTQNAPLPENAGALVSVATWIPNGGWTTPAVTSESTPYGELSGYSTTGTVTMDQAYMDPFEHKEELSGMGYVADPMLEASGPGSNMWGYKRTVDGKEQILVLGYKTQPTSSKPNEPLQFNCPCTIRLSAFVSEPFDPKGQN